MGHVWVLEYPSSQLGMGCGGVGQNESGGVKQCTGHFHSFISSEQGKENDAPFIISSLVSFQSTRDKNVI